MTIFGFTTTNNLKETFQILWTTWIFGDYAVIPKSIKNPTIIDVGSHIGISALYFKYFFPQSNLTCYEPNPNTFKILQKNTLGLKKIKLINSAIHDFTGYTELSLDEVAWGDSIVDRNTKHKIGKVRVKVISAKDLCKSHIDLLKLDSEGSEYAIIQDLDKSNNINYIDRIVMEFHGKINNKKRLKTILDILNKNNFKYTIGRDIRIRMVSESKVLLDNSSKYDFLIISAWKR